MKSMYVFRVSFFHLLHYVWSVRHHARLLEWKRMQNVLLLLRMLLLRRMLHQWFMTHNVRKLGVLRFVQRLVREQSIRLYVEGVSWMVTKARDDRPVRKRDFWKSWPELVSTAIVAANPTTGKLCSLVVNTGAVGVKNWGSGFIKRAKPHGTSLIVRRGRWCRGR